MNEIIYRHLIHDMECIYLQGTDRKGNRRTGMMLIPAGWSDRMAGWEEREVEPLIQVKLIGDDYPFHYSQGRTMRNSETTMGLTLKGQVKEAWQGKTVITTLLTDQRGLEYRHFVTFGEQAEAVEISCEVINGTDRQVAFEMLSSAALGGITPFEAGLARETLELYQIRSTWANEGRLVHMPVEELQLEPSWKPSGANGIRFGQVGSMPNRTYFPFIGIEDKKRRVCWGIQLAIGSSWQLEAYRKDDGLSLSGGIADREFGHWLKRLNPGETLQPPKALVSAVHGDMDELCQRITKTMRCELTIHPEEQELPILFNEFCTTWGNPQAYRIRRLADLAACHGIRYFVIDCGWYKKSIAAHDAWNIQHGDWIANRDLFPGGIRKLTEYLHERGLKAGIWFEAESCGRESELFCREELLAKRDGLPITAGNRRFLDMRLKAAEGYLDERVIAFLRENQFDYIKLDYNANLGIGPDGADSFGAALYDSVQATLRWICKLRQRLPGLLIENCAAGGHRLVEPFTSITDISSCSDAHESSNIPLIAANIHRMIPVRQSQIWAVLHPEQSSAMLFFKLSSTFLGRMCLSGEIDELSREQWEIIDRAIAFYRKAAPVIDLGRSSIDCHTGLSYKEPEGYQIVKRRWEGSLLVVIHTFEHGPERLAFDAEDCYVAEAFHHAHIRLLRRGKQYCLEGLQEFDGIGILLEKERKF